MRLPSIHAAEWRPTIGSHASAERPLIGQKQKATVSSARASAATIPTPPASERMRITPAVRLAAIKITCVGRNDPMSPRRSSGPKRYR